MAKNKPASDTLQTYLCDSPIQHDGDIYEIGEEIQLSEAHAKLLMEAKAVHPAPKATKQAPNQ